MWIASKRQMIKRGDGYVWVGIGDPIPEAAHWPYRDRWVEEGYIRWISKADSEVKEAEKKSMPIEDSVEVVKDTKIKMKKFKLRIENK